MRSRLTKIPAACTFKRSVGQHTLFWEARSGKPQAEPFANGNLQRRVRQRWEGGRLESCYRFSMDWRAYA